MLARYLYKGWAGQRLSVLGFHALPAQPQPFKPGELTLNEFETLLGYLRVHLSFLPLEEAVARLRAGNLPRGAACITLDDGYASWNTGVASILEQMSLHATFFVCTGQLSSERLWNERLNEVMARTEGRVSGLHLVLAGTEHLQRWPTSTHRERCSTFQLLEEIIKRATPPEREGMLSALESQIGGAAHSSGDFSAEDVRTLYSRGFGIGAHTVSHPILSSLPPAEALREIAESREVLEGLIGGPVRGFAYPNGRPGRDYGPEHVQMALHCGYTHAVTTGGGAASSATDVMQLPRFTPWGPGRLRSLFQLARNTSVTPAVAARAPGDERGQRAWATAFGNHRSIDIQAEGLMTARGALLE